MSKHLTPTRHGNWHVINGELVDLDQAPAALPEPIAVPEPDPAPDAASAEPVTHSAPRKRRNID